MNVWLEIAQQGASVKRVELGDVAVIGRSKDCDLRIASQEVSRRHCKISVTESQVFVRDLGSANGTFVDGQKIPTEEDVAVPPGAILSIGGVGFKVRFEPQSLPVDPDDEERGSTVDIPVRQTAGSSADSTAQSDRGSSGDVPNQSFEAEEGSLTTEEDDTEEGSGDPSKPENDPASEAISDTANFLLADTETDLSGSQKKKTESSPDDSSSGEDANLEEELENALEGDPEETSDEADRDATNSSDDDPDNALGDFLSQFPE